MITKVAIFVDALLTLLFSGSIGTRKSKSVEKVTKELATVGTKLFEFSHYQTTDTWEYSLNIAVEMMDNYPLDASPELLRSIANCIDHLVISNAIFPPTINWNGVDHQGDEGFMLRRYLERHKRFHENFTVNDRRFHLGLEAVIGSILGDLPSIPLSAQEGSGFGVRLGELLHDPQEAIDAVVGYSFDGDLQSARLFEDLRNRFERNICAVSGIDYNNQPSNAHRFVMPRDFNGSTQQLFNGYLSGTPFKQLLDTPLPFSIPNEARFEHTHIVGGTGHGKTQLLSHLIMQDIAEIQAGKKKSIVVIDSQGDFIQSLSSLGLFDPTQDGNLADKLVVIDPRDVEYPTALNMFAINEERLAQYGQAEREQVFNGAIELYEHFFKGLLGAELTAKQGVAFSYMARMMLEMPNSTIYTLRDLMDNPSGFKDQLSRLSGSTRMFFERELLSKSYNQTRKQISQRLWGVLAIPAFERMFGQVEHKVDLYELMNEGKIILINTSKSLLKNEGSAIFGKFFVAAIAQAVSERSEIPMAKRTETIIYLDEAHEYADQSLDILLTQGRKYKAGVVIAHQYLDQLPQQAKRSLATNASTKIVGGLEYTDQQSLAKQMNTDAEFLSSMQKHESGTVFALWIKNVIPQALKLNVPFGRLASETVLSDDGMQILLKQNRERYCEKATSEPVVKDVPTPSTSNTEDLVHAHEPMINEGRGGKQHKTLQQMIKAIGHEYGFGVSVEAKCTNSDGAIDVLLNGEKTTIAIEVSITTSAEHELQNLKKCLAEPLDQILCISPDDAHRIAIQNLCIEELPQVQFNRLTFLNPSSLNEYIAQFDERETTLIRGYEVIVKTQQSDPRDVEYRKNRIKQVLTGNIG